MVSEANEPGSESGKRSDDRRGVPEGTPQEGGASTPLAAPGSFAAAAMVTRTASWRRARHDPAMLAGRTAARTSARIVLGWTATRAPAGRDRDARVLEEAGHGVAVGEHDAGEPALAAAEEDARHRRARQDERAAGGPHLEGRLLDRAAHGVGAAELRGVDVGPAAHLLRQAEVPRARDV